MAFSASRKHPARLFSRAVLADDGVIVHRYAKRLRTFKLKRVWRAASHAAKFHFDFGTKLRRWVPRGLIGHAALLCRYCGIRGAAQLVRSLTGQPILLCARSRSRFRLALPGRSTPLRLHVNASALRNRARTIAQKCRVAPRHSQQTPACGYSRRRATLQVTDVHDRRYA
jgi:hypothetical protein